MEAADIVQRLKYLGAREGSFATGDWTLVKQVDGKELAEDARTPALLPKDFPATRAFSPLWATELLSYAVFQNDRTDSYLVTMSDKRPVADKKTGNNEDNLVTCEILEKGDSSHDDIMKQAHEIWVGNYVQLYRYYPFTSYKNISSMTEADRLRDHFKAAAAEPSKPERALFEFYPAFCRAYSGQEGFSQALDDVYGAEGNIKFCFVDNNVQRSHWAYDQYNNDGHIGEKYEVPVDSFLSLYEKMNEQDRKDFQAAVHKFTEEKLPSLLDKIEDKGNAGFGFATKVADSIACLQIACDKGTGALDMPDGRDKIEFVKGRLLTVITGEKFWERAAHDEYALKANPAIAFQ